jgi:hypothetical protein
MTLETLDPAMAGHDSSTLAERNVRQVLIDRGGQPVVLERSTFTR